MLAGQATAIPKTGDSMVEMVRCLRVARATAMKARTQAANALGALLVTAPVELREQPRDLDPASCRHGGAAAPRAIVTPTAATKLALRTVAERQLALTPSAPRWMPNWTGLPPGRHRRCRSVRGRR